MNLETYLKFDSEIERCSHNVCLVCLLGFVDTKQIGQFLLNLEQYNT